MNKNSVATILATAALAVSTSFFNPVFAHHSFATYDMLKTTPQVGTIKEFRWGAPHSSMVLVYKDKAGKTGEMSLISGSPLMFSKQGFTPRDFKPGERVKVGFHPYIDGSPGGALASLTLAGGRTFSDTEAAGISPRGAK